MAKYCYEISVIIVSWNVKEYLLSCISSVVKNFNNITFEIIVVDNASTDGTVDDVEGRLNEVNLKIIKNDFNLGFAEANRQGVNIAKGEVILFLNPDTILLDCKIGALLRKLRSDENIAMVGCKVLNYDFTTQKTCARYSPTLKRNFFNLVLMSDYLRMFDGKGPYYNSSNYNREINVECISGCFMLVKTEILQKYGAFDDSYFMYAEDIELCNRIREKGYQILYDPEMEIIHYGGMSSIQHEESYFGYLKKYEADCMYFSRLHGEKKAKILQIYILIGSFLRMVGLYFEKLRCRRNRKIETRLLIKKHGAVMKWAIQRMPKVGWNSKR